LRAELILYDATVVSKKLALDEPSPSKSTITIRINDRLLQKGRRGITPLPSHSLKV